MSCLLKIAQKFLYLWVQQYSQTLVLRVLRVGADRRHALPARQLHAQVVGGGSAQRLHNIAAAQVKLQVLALGAGAHRLPVDRKLLSARRGRMPRGTPRS